MEKQFEIIRRTRSNFLKLISGLSIDQLNKIPMGFNNNIIWNLGHLVCSQQILCYKLGNSEPRISLDSVAKYGRGTKPETEIDIVELEILKESLVSNIDALEADYKDQIFSNFTTYITSYGVELTSIEDAIKFVAVHEGVHVGYAMALKRLVVA